MLPPLTGRNDSFNTDGTPHHKPINLAAGGRHHVIFRTTDRHSDAPTTCSSDHSGSDSVEDLFVKASVYLNPDRCFRHLVYLYGERKLLVLFMVHFACTMIVWRKLTLVWGVSLKHLHLPSTLRNVQIRRTKKGCPRRRSLLLVEAYGANAGVWDYACNFTPNGPVTPHHGKILHCLALRVVSCQVYSFQKDASHTYPSWLYNGTDCLFRNSLLFLFLWNIMSSRRTTIL